MDKTVPVYAFECNECHGDIVVIDEKGFIGQCSGCEAILVRRTSHHLPTQITTLYWEVASSEEDMLMMAHEIDLDTVNTFLQASEFIDEDIMSDVEDIAF